MEITLNGTTGITNTGALSVTGITTLGALGSSVITSGTAQASTSGTSIDFTGIPTWVKRITVMFNGVSVSGTSNPLFQIGAGSVTNTGYLGSSVSGGTSVTAANYTTGYGLLSNAAANILHGSATICFLGSNTWEFSGVFAYSNAAGCMWSAGSVSLGGTLDRVRITTVNGTDTFDAGSINILYE